MPDSEFRERIVQNLTAEEFTIEFENALFSDRSFTFETNLMMPYPKGIIARAKEKGFRIEIYFFCLSSQRLARERVDIRVKNNGHFVDEKTIALKWKEGYKNINLHFTDFDYLLFIDNSLEKTPTPLFEMEITDKTNYTLTKHVNELPEYAKRRLPAIFDLLR